MAHFVYPAGTPLGTVPALYVVPSTDWQTTIQQLFKAINGDQGGTWAPSAFITVGGSGLQLTGTGHELAVSARLTLQNLAEIRVENGASVRANGSSGDIFLKVSSNVATLEVQSGAVAQVNSGGDLNIYGDLTFKDASGPGAATWEDNTTATFEDGSTITLESGAQMVVADGAQIEVAGQILLTSAGDITVPSGGLILLAGGATLTAQGTNNLSSLALVGASTWPTMTTARTVLRKATSVIPLTFNNGASTVGPDDPDAWRCKSDASGAPAFRTRLALAAGKSSILHVPNLPIGSVLASAAVTSKGTDAALVASTLPTYQIVSWSSGEGGLVGHSSATADAGLALTFGATSTETTITATGTTLQKTVEPEREYGILVTHPYENTGSGQGAWIYTAEITVEASSIQL